MADVYAALDIEPFRYSLLRLFLGAEQGKRGSRQKGNENDNEWFWAIEHVANILKLVNTQSEFLLEVES